MWDVKIFRKTLKGNLCTQSSKCETKLTHRTCRATAPSVLSLFVNRSVGNSCRAGKDRDIRLDQLIYSMLVCAYAQYVSASAQWRTENICPAERARLWGQKPIELLCTDKEPCLRSTKPDCVWQSSCALPKTVCASSESNKRIGKWKKQALGGQSEGKEEREHSKNRARDI